MKKKYTNISTNWAASITIIAMIFFFIHGPILPTPLPRYATMKAYLHEAYTLHSWIWCAYCSHESCCYHSRLQPCLWWEIPSGMWPSLSWQFLTLTVLPPSSWDFSANTFFTERLSLHTDAIQKDQNRILQGKLKLLAVGGLIRWKAPVFLPLSFRKTFTAGIWTLFKSSQGNQPPLSWALILAIHF